MHANRDRRRKGVPGVNVHTRTRYLDMAASTGVRNVTITATLSMRDLSPTFKLEEQSLGMSSAGNLWVGTYEGVYVQGALDVFYMSEGWKGQVFVVTVEATDPAAADKSWKGEFKAMVKKGHAVIDEELDVGLGEAAA